MTHQVAIDPGFDLLDLHYLDSRRYPHLLESTAAGPQGRFDILFAFPGESIVLRNIHDFDFLSVLDECWRENAISPYNGQSLPFTGGWFLYLGYELSGQIEPQLRLPADNTGLPLASATRVPAAIVHDHQTGERWIVSEQQSCLTAIEEDISQLGEGVSVESFPFCQVSEDPSQDYLSAVEKILQYIRDGEVFQVNLSRQWRAHWPKEIHSATLYRRLRVCNPGPFSGFASWENNAIISSSPERLVEIRGDRVQTRPIAGTRPRGHEENADRVFSEELLDHPKERAEHIMLIDLERNDLGRIAIPGSVTVSELMTLESYATVHHIVSNVEARKRSNVMPGQVIRAVFPGGTITGCPKVRCMEIIAELEGTGRGGYTGSMGYLNRDGSMDLNILIRTMVRSGDRLSFRAGAGIVYDSIPVRELEETRAKASGMLTTLSGAVL